MESSHVSVEYWRDSKMKSILANPTPSSVGFWATALIGVFVMAILTVQMLLVVFDFIAMWGSSRRRWFYESYSLSKDLLRLTLVSTVVSLPLMALYMVFIAA